LAKKGEWFRCFVSSSDSSIMNLLEKLGWFDGAIVSIPPHNKHSQNDLMKYFGNTTQNILRNSNNKEVCCVDFLINDIANSSIKDAITIEKAYDENRLQEIVFCAYKTKNLLSTSITDMIEIFDIHEQIFIIKDEKVYKLHVTKENVHKLFLS
jgi:hypothetical protein